jgi:parallel beta helix pectate lyase-like protein
VRENPGLTHQAITRRRALFLISVAGATSLLSASDVLDEQPTVRRTDSDLGENGADSRPGRILLSGPGIDPTGVHDSWQGIQAVVDAAPSGAQLTLPPGTYTMGASLVLRSGHTLTGPSATVIAAPTLGPTALIAGSDEGGSVAPDGTITTATAGIVVRDLIIDGNAGARGFANDPQAHTLAFPFASGVCVQNCRVRNSAGAAIVLYNCRDSVVDGNSIENSSGNGILVMQAATRVRISNNVVNGTRYQNGIFVMAQHGQASVDTTITGNTVRNVADFGIEVGDIILAGERNHTRAMVTRNVVEAAVNNGISFRSVSEGQINDNVIQDCGEHSSAFGAGGILVSGDNQACELVTIRGNDVSTSAGATGSSDGIFATGVTGLTVTGNTVRDAPGIGINVTGSAVTANPQYPDGRRVFRDINISRNTVASPGSIGIAAQDASEGGNVLIEENIVELAGTTGIAASASLGSSKGLRVEGNEIERPEHQGVVVYGWSGVAIRNNQVGDFGHAATIDDQRCAILLVDAADSVAADNHITAGDAARWGYGIHDSRNVQVSADDSYLPDRVYNNTDVVIAP